MTERPIFFSDDMIDAILSGAKTQTRRPIKPQPPENTEYVMVGEDGARALCVSAIEGGEFKSSDDPWRTCKYGVPGDVLTVFTSHYHGSLRLLIKDIRVERLQDITEDDARAEGVGRLVSIPGDKSNYCCGFYYKWQQIYSECIYSWDKNSWVWVIEFERLTDG